MYRVEAVVFDKSDGGRPMGQVFRLRSWDYGQKRPGSWME